MFQFLVIGSAAVVVLYYLKRCLSSPTVPAVSKLPSTSPISPKEQKVFTPAELAEFDGSDPTRPIYLAIKGDVFDVTRAVDFYGKGNSYNLFTGKDASRALAKMSLNLEDCVPDYEDLSWGEKDSLNAWYASFSQKYPRIGKVLRSNSHDKAAQDTPAVDAPAESNKPLEAKKVE
mmetsp:Transcript_23013/g.39538  ORF Transcript_23013/g.39538 Transcript_23013/m.39538 type:complete len:175 (+) Transcript_23013:153-677(+)